MQASARRVGSVRSAGWNIIAAVSPSKTPASSSMILPPPSSSAGVPITWTVPDSGPAEGSRQRDRGGGAARGDEVVPAAVTEVGQRVVFEQVRDSWLTAAPDGPERGFESGYAALHRETLVAEPRGEQARGVLLTEGQLRVLMDLPAYRYGLAAELSDFGRQALIDGFAHRVHRPAAAGPQARKSPIGVPPRSLGGSG